MAHPLGKQIKDNLQALADAKVFNVNGTNKTGAQLGSTVDQNYTNAIGDAIEQYAGGTLLPPAPALVWGTPAYTLSTWNLTPNLTRSKVTLHWLVFAPGTWTGTASKIRIKKKITGSLSNPEVLVELTDLTAIAFDDTDVLFNTSYDYTLEVIDNYGTIGTDSLVETVVTQTFPAPSNPTDKIQVTPGADSAGLLFAGEMDAGNGTTPNKVLLVDRYSVEMRKAPANPNGKGGYTVPLAPTWGAWGVINETASVALVVQGLDNSYVYQFRYRIINVYGLISAYNTDSDSLNFGTPMLPEAPLNTSDNSRAYFVTVANTIFGRQTTTPHNVRVFFSPSSVDPAEDADYGGPWTSAQDGFVWYQTDTAFWREWEGVSGSWQSSPAQAVLSSMVAPLIADGTMTALEKTTLLSGDGLTHSGYQGLVTEKLFFEAFGTKFNVRFETDPAYQAYVAQFLTVERVLLNPLKGLLSNMTAASTGVTNEITTELTKLEAVKKDLGLSLFNASNSGLSSTVIDRTQLPVSPSDLIGTSTYFAYVYAQAAKKITIKSLSGAVGPTGNTTGDLWIRTDTNSVSQWNGSSWVVITTSPSFLTFKQTSGLSRTLFAVSVVGDLPAVYNAGDLFILGGTDVVGASPYSKTFSALEFYVALQTRTSGGFKTSEWAAGSQLFTDTGFLRQVSIFQTAVAAYQFRDFFVPNADQTLSAPNGDSILFLGTAPNGRFYFSQKNSSGSFAPADWGIPQNVGDTSTPETVEKIVSQFTSTDVVSILQKNALALQWVGIKTQETSLVTNAATYSVASANLVSAYNALLTLFEGTNGILNDRGSVSIRSGVWANIHTLIQNWDTEAQNVQAGIDVILTDITPPTVPSVPTTTVNSDSTVKVFYGGSTDSGSGVLEYKIWRAMLADKSDRVIVGTANASGVYFTDTKTAVGTAYYYGASAVDKNLNESAIAWMVGTTLAGWSTAPGAPTTVVAVAKRKAITISWTTPFAPVTLTFNVYKSTTGAAGAYSLIGNVSSTSFVEAVGNLEASAFANWYYKIVAVDVFSNVGPYSVASAAVDVSGYTGYIPSAPTTLNQPVATRGKIALSWTQVTTMTDGKAATDTLIYEVWKSTDGGLNYLTKIGETTNPVLDEAVGYVEASAFATWRYQVRVREPNFGNTSGYTTYVGGVLTTGYVGYTPVQVGQPTTSIDLSGVNRFIHVTWNKVTLLTDGNAIPAGDTIQYVLLKSIDGGVNFKLVQSATFTDNGTSLTFLDRLGYVEATDPSITNVRYEVQAWNVAPNVYGVASLASAQVVTTGYESFIPEITGIAVSAKVEMVTKSDGSFSGRVRASWNPTTGTIAANKSVASYHVWLSTTGIGGVYTAQADVQGLSLYVDVPAGTESATLQNWYFRVQPVTTYGVTSASTVTQATTTDVASWGTFVASQQAVTALAAKRAINVTWNRQTPFLLDFVRYEVQISRDNANWYAPNLAATTDADLWYSGALNGYATVSSAAQPGLLIPFLPIPLTSDGVAPVASGQIYYLRVRTVGTSGGSSAYASASTTVLPTLYSDLAKNAVRSDRVDLQNWLSGQPIQQGLLNQTSFDDLPSYPDNPAVLDPGAAGYTATGGTWSGGTFTKNTGVGSWTDSRIRSNASLGIGARAGFLAGQTNIDFMIGLNTDPQTGINYMNLDFAIQAGSAGAILVYESGVPQGSFGSYLTTDHLEVFYDGLYVHYLKNGAEFRKVFAGPDKQFFLDSTFYANGSATGITFSVVGADVLQNNFSTGLPSGWSTNVEATSTFPDTSTWRITGTAAGHGYFRSTAPANGRFALIRIRVITGSATIGFENFNTISITNRDWKTYVFASSGVNTFVAYIGSANDVFEVNIFYVGDGSYLTGQLKDSSTQNNRMVLGGGWPSNTSVSGKGIQNPVGYIPNLNLTNFLWVSGWISPVAGAIGQYLFSSTLSEIGTAGSVALTLNNTINGRLTVGLRVVANGAYVSAHVDGALTLPMNKIGLLIDTTQASYANAFTLYVNGAVVPLIFDSASYVQNQLLASGPLFIGTSAQYPNTPYTGMMDELRVYNRLPLPAEEAYLYLNPAGPIPAVFGAERIVAGSISTEELKVGSVIASRMQVSNLDVDSTLNAISLNSGLMYSSGSVNAGLATLDGMDQRVYPGNNAQNYLFLGNTTYPTPKFRLGTTTAYFYFDGANLFFKSVNVSLTTAGVTTIGNGVNLGHSSNYLNWGSSAFGSDYGSLQVSNASQMTSLIGTQTGKFQWGYGVTPGAPSSIFMSLDENQSSVGYASLSVGATGYGGILKLRRTVDGSESVQFANVADEARMVGAFGTNSFTWYQNGAELMRLHTNGFLGVGTATPTTRAHVKGTLTVDPLGNTNWAEGIRVGNASAGTAGYSIIIFGVDTAQASGAQPHQWWVGKDGADFGFTVFSQDLSKSVMHFNAAGELTLTSVGASGANDSYGIANTYLIFNDTTARNPGATPPSWHARSIRWDFSTAANTGTGGSYSGVMTFAPWDGTSSSTGDSSYQLAFGNSAVNQTLNSPQGTPQLRIRQGIDSTWGAWYDLITSVGGQTIGGTLAVSTSITSPNFIANGQVTFRTNTTDGIYNALGTSWLRLTDTSGNAQLRSASGGIYLDGVNVNIRDVNGGTTGVLNVYGNSTLNGTLAVTSFIYAQNYLEVVGHIYNHANIFLLNKAGNGWNPFASRNTAGAEAYYDLSNIATITALNSIQCGFNVASTTLLSSLVNGTASPFYVNGGGGTAGQFYVPNNGALNYAPMLNTNTVVSGLGFALPVTFGAYRVSGANYVGGAFIATGNATDYTHNAAFYFSNAGAISHTNGYVTFSQSVVLSNDSNSQFGPNSIWGAYLRVGGNGYTAAQNTLIASVVTTNGNLHLDAGGAKDLYLNYYSGSNLYFGQGTGGPTRGQWSQTFLAIDQVSAAAPTATPYYLNLGLSFSNGTTRDSLKIYLYNDGATGKFGFGVGANNDIQYHSQGTHDFYVNNTEVMSITANAYPEVFDLVIDSNAKLDLWVNNTTGAYPRVLIRSGTWTSSVTNPTGGKFINLDSGGPGTIYVKGEPGATIIFNPSGTVNYYGFFRSATILYPNQFSFSGFSILMTASSSGSCYAFYGLINITSVRAQVTTGGGSNGSAFTGCSFLDGCYAITDSGYSGTALSNGYDTCNHLNNCIAQIDYGSPVASGNKGFYNCSYLENCIAKTPNAVGNNVSGYYQCNYLSNCQATLSLASSGGNGAGFANCGGLDNCYGSVTSSTTATGTTVAGFLSCARLSNCIGEGGAPASNSGFGFSNCFTMATNGCTYFTTSKYNGCYAGSTTAYPVSDTPSGGCNY